ncbi:MAG: hypothetical protein IJC81_05575 [Clostridia bacterium]|nr:hypothetical protein [Clostridia bacterium]
MKKMTVLLLAILVCVFFVSCNEATDESKASVSFDPDAPNLPSPDEVNIGGEFVILVSGNSSRNDFSADETAEKPVDIAIYQRNEAIKQKYGVEILTKDVTGFGTTTGKGVGPGYNMIANDYISATGKYGAALIGTYDVATLAYNRFLQDMNQIPYIDLSNEYWDQKANADLSINGKMYYTTGDIGVTDNVMTHAILFNKDMCKEYKIDEPYALVNEGKWTLEKYSELVKKVGRDANDDGIYDSNDIYGLMTWNDPMIAILASSGEKIATINKDGFLELSLYNPRVVNLYDMYEDLVFDMSHVYNYQYDNTTGKASPQGSWDTARDSVFSSGRALFYMNLLEVVERHRDSDVDFGVLPYPKFNETQENYGHAVSAYHTNFLCVPIVTGDYTRSGIVLEELAYQGKKLLTPAYYDQTLVGRGVRDQDSVAMLDIIFASRVFDVGQYYNVGTYKDQLANLFTTRIPFTSLYETYRSQAESKIESINELMQGVR